MDIRGRRLRQQNEKVTRFISSIRFDGAIAKEVLMVNQAHMVSLVRSGEVDRRVGARCLRFLESASTEVDPSSVSEDYHQLLEQSAVDTLGVDVAGYLNLGKSRNDQVATALRMHLKLVLAGVISAAVQLQDALLDKVQEQGALAMPGYTHLQHAQPTTLAHHMFAYFDPLERDVQRLFDAYQRADASPMGSAALAGTSVSVSRREVATLLGFASVVDNAMDGVSSRDVELEALSCFAVTMSSLSRLTEELVLWASKEFSFVDIPDEYAATSSIMPQKKNPIVAEIARAKSGSVFGALSAALAIVKGLPYSYNLDLQEVTPHLWQAAEDTSASLSLLAAVVRGMRFVPAAISKSMLDDFSTATSLANYLVKEFSIPFRQAHAIVGSLVRDAGAEGLSLEEVAAKRLAGAVRAETGRRIAVTEATVRSVLSVESSLEGIVTQGGSNPRFIAGGLRARSKTVKSSRKRLSSLRSRTGSSERALTRAVRSISREVNN